MFISDATERETVITGLRARLAGLGGVQGSGTVRRRPESVGGESGRPGSVARARALGFEREETCEGAVFVRRREVDLTPWLDRAGCPGAARAGQLVRLASSTPRSAIDPVRRDGSITVLDVESLGLRGSGVVAFLVGAGVQHGERLAVDQFLLVDPGGERALLTRVAALVGGTTVLLSYNGRTFDLPVLAARCIVNRLDPVAVEPRLHCDLLAPVRRLFRHRLGACTLRHAEVGLLGFERVADVPGHEAPGRYRAWLRGAESEVLSGVVEHNQLDLCATVVLAARLAAHVEGALVGPVHPSDRYSLALHLERAGQDELAETYLREAFEAANPPWDRRAGLRLASRLRRLPGGCHRAAPILSRLRGQHPGDLVVARALAICLERMGETMAALEVCRQAEVAWRERSVGGTWRVTAPRPPTAEVQSDWERRIARLRSRLVRRGEAMALARSPGGWDAPPGPVPSLGLE